MSSKMTTKTVNGALSTTPLSYYLDPEVVKSQFTLFPGGCDVRNGQNGSSTAKILAKTGSSRPDFIKILWTQNLNDFAE